MTKRQTLSKMFGGQVWNIVGAIVSTGPHQFNSQNALQTFRKHQMTEAVCMSVPTSI